MAVPSNYITEIERQIGQAEADLTKEQFHDFLYQAVLMFDKYAKKFEEETDKT